MKANRKRLISSYKVDLNKIERVESKAFTQNLALLIDDSFDYRKNARKFKELPNDLTIF